MAIAAVAVLALTVAAVCFCRSLLLLLLLLQVVTAVVQVRTAADLQTISSSLFFGSFCGHTTLGVRRILSFHVHIKTDKGRRRRHIYSQLLSVFSISLLVNGHGKV